jgi:hypothetical protein
MTDRNRDGRQDPFFLLDLDGDNRADILVGFRSR